MTPIGPPRENDAADEAAAYWAQRTFDERSQEGENEMDALLEALIDTDEKRHAYLTNAEFHATVNVLAQTLPGLVASYAALGIARNEERRREIARISG